MDKTAALLRALIERPTSKQRDLASLLGISLGSVNSLWAEAVNNGLISPEHSGNSCVSPAGLSYMKKYKVDGALILAAGFGSRFVPLTYDTPKGLLPVFGERMIERQINQLNIAGIKDITLVVGYLKEKFDYLIDKYGVKLLYNPEFSEKNTLASVWHAIPVLKDRNMYILNSDNWMKSNPYHSFEPGSWYSCSYIEGNTKEYCVSFNKKGLINDVSIGGHDSWVMLGPAYLSVDFSKDFLPMLDKAYKRPGTENLYWEDVYVESLHSGSKNPPLRMDARCLPKGELYEFENLEELRLFDKSYEEKSDNITMELIAKTFNVNESCIKRLRCLKAGMTNQSFLFEVNNSDYICRVPGNGTSKLINRKQEYDNYNAVKCLGITENLVFFDSDSGYKISEYYENSHNCDAQNPEQVKRCMEKIHILHDANLTVSHDFDLRERITFYEKLCMESGGIPFEDYTGVRSKMNELLDIIEKKERPHKLCHIDCVPDNFLFIDEGRDLRLIDWEYAGMADPLLDIAMFAIYAYYDTPQTEELMKYYFKRTPTDEEREIVNIYIGLSGFLWALWAIYKSNLGTHFGDYTLKQYRYAKESYKIVKNI